MAQPNPLRLISLGLRQLFSSQSLERREEPDAVTGVTGPVDQYAQLMSTKLAISYAIAMEVIHRARSEPRGAQQALDLACGPGQFTLCLARHLGYRSVTGLDLSPGMMKVANENATHQSMQDTCKFELADVTRLERFEAERFDLTSFADAAHHMHDLETVSSMLQGMERITKPDGLVFLIDVARLGTSALTEEYVDLLGADYIEKGLPEILADFRHSMFAAWTTEELKTVAPNNTGRVWLQLFCPILPSLQVILGLPVGRTQAFVRSGFPWDTAHVPVVPAMKVEWTMARWALFLGTSRNISPVTDHASSPASTQNGAH